MNYYDIDRPRAVRSVTILLTILSLALGYLFLEERHFPGLPPEGALSLNFPIPEILSPPARAGSVTVYFNQPGVSGSGPTPDEYLWDAIAVARLSIEVAVYDLDLWTLRDALLDAHRRGVKVRVVAEGGNLETPELQALIEAGIPVVPDRADGLMHDKFVIIDRHQVWTGSMNFTRNGVFRNDNNLLSISNDQAVGAFLREFEEMFTARLFGAYSPTGRAITYQDQGTTVEIFFSPDDGVRARILDLIQEAQVSVHFLAFSFTSDELSSALMAGKEAGLTVRGVFDESQNESNQGGEYPVMRAAGLDVVLDGNPYKMHHKVMVIDERIVITGSYNFSNSAETRNDENVVILFDAELAGYYLAEFERVYANGQD